MSSPRISLVPLVFLALWVLWFVFPLTRPPAQSQWKTRLMTVPTNAPIPSSDTSRDAVFVRALNESGAVFVAGQSSKRWQALEEAGRLYPNDAAICAAQILASASELHLGSVRHPGPSSSADFNWSVKLTKTQAPAPEVLKAWLAAAARGAKLEPNNTFWDWSQLIGLLAAQRDSEIWPLLKAASFKTGYDDHANDGSLARIRLAQQQNVVSPIGQIGIAATSLFPHFAVMREAARQVSDDASGLRLLGEAAQKKQALEGLRDFAAMARVMRREAKSSIGSLVGTAIEAIALYGGAYSPTPLARGRRPAMGASAAIYGRDPRSLLAFALQQKRADIAAQLGAQWTEMGVWRGKTRPAILSGTLIGLNVPDLAMAQGGDWFGPLLIAGIPTLLGVAVLCSLLLRFVPAWQREGEVQPSRFSWVGSGLLTVFALLILSSPGIWAWVDEWRTPGKTTFDLLFAPFMLREGSGVAPLTWQYHFLALLGFVCSLWLAAMWDARRQGKPTLGMRLRGLFHPPDDGMAHFDLAPLLTLAATIGAFFLLSFGVAAFLIVPGVNDNFESLRDYAGLTLVGLGVMFSLPLLIRLRTAQGRAFALVLARRFAWGQLIFLTLLWGLLWMIAMPAQRRFDAQYARQLQVGEFQLIRKQVGL